MNIEELNRRPLSALLQCPPARHKIMEVHDNPTTITKPRNQTTMIPYQERCAPALRNLGFAQVSELKWMRADTPMISALIERWRPETNTFHMPTGEITVTLQDISCLLGLPITGYPVTGHTHDSLHSGMYIKDFLGVLDPEEAMYARKKDGRMKASAHHISLPFLRKKFTAITNESSEVDVEQYTRAFLLNLCGAMLFPTTQQSVVPAYFLQFFLDLRQPKQYNWGGALLASLYYELTIASRPGRNNFAGCSQLLMMWSWSHFPVFRPEIKETQKNKIVWSRDEDPVLCNYWSREPKKYDKSAHHSSVEVARDLFDRMTEGEVDWEPYVSYHALLPSRVTNEAHCWTIRTPLIFFWIVSYHYPDRVMRSFGLYQQVPPPPPLPWRKQDELQCITDSD